LDCGSVFGIVLNQQDKFRKEFFQGGFQIATETINHKE
jgi:hypothetical protein